MIEIPDGTRVYGMQLPIQSKSRTFVADWELSAGPADLAQVARAADDHGFFYVAVCDHIAIPESLASDDGHLLAGLHLHPLLARRADRAHHLLSHAYVLPYRHPLIAAKEFETLDYLSGGRAIVGIGAGHVEAEFAALGVDHARRGKLVEEKLPPLIEALEHEFVGGVGASRARSSRRVHRSGSRVRAPPRSGARRRSATVGCRKDRRTRRWSKSCRRSAKSTDAPTGP